MCAGERCSEELCSDRVRCRTITPFMPQRTPYKSAHNSRAGKRQTEINEDGGKRQTKHESKAGGDCLKGGNAEDFSSRPFRDAILLCA